MTEGSFGAPGFQPGIVAETGVAIGDLVLPILDGKPAFRILCVRIEVRKRVVGIGERHHFHDRRRMLPCLPASGVRFLIELPAVGHLVASADKLAHDVTSEVVGLVDDLVVAAALQGGADIGEQLIDALPKLIALEPAMKRSAWSSTR